jgi:hypothetical protein
VEGIEGVVGHDLFVEQFAVIEMDEGGWLLHIFCRASPVCDRQASCVERGKRMCLDPGKERFLTVGLILPEG